MILLKGFLDIKRPPTIRMGDKTLKIVAEITYLGVHYGVRLNITPHINYICQKSKKTFNQLASVPRGRWGINTHDGNIV